MSTTTLTPPLSAAPRRRLGWPELGIATVGLLVAEVVVTVAYVLLVGMPSIVAAVILGAVVNFVVVALALAVRVRTLAPLRLGSPGRRWLLVGPAVGVGMCLVSIVLSLAWQAMTGDTSNPQQYLDDAASAGGASLAVMLVFGGLLIPLGEELLFRGVVYGALRRYGPVVAGLVSAAVFGVFHLSPLVVIFAFVLGVVCAALVERSGSIWPAVIAHAVLNTIGFALAAVLA